MTAEKNTNSLLSVNDLRVYYTAEGETVEAVNGVSFELERGETLGLVGETGAGKTTIAKAIMSILPDPPAKIKSGEILFHGEDVTHVNAKKLRQLREKMQIIFQDPFSSLNPRMTTVETIREPLVLSGRFTKAEIDEKVEQIMETVGLDRRFRNSYPHELDGGRRQRIGIARALVIEPEFVVCDEPVSALDVSIQAQILNLMQDLQESRGLTYVFITHDLSVVRHISDEICVMYLGQLVEKCPAKELFAHPIHPYTKALLSAIPIPDIHTEKKRIILKGEVTSPIEPKPGCRFAARCPHACEQCKQPQTIREIEPGHFISCVRAEEFA